MEESIPQKNKVRAEKISLHPLVNDSLKEYEARLLQKAFKIFGDVIGKESGNVITKAQFSSVTPDHVPSAMALYLLAPNTPRRTLRSFFEQMTRYWLNDKQESRILSSQEIEFSQYYFLELLIYIKDEKQRTLVKKNLQNFAQEIVRGAVSDLSSSYVLRLKHLSSEEKNSHIYANARLLQSRFPKKFEADFFKSVDNFLLNTRPEFQEKRSIRHLGRIICTFYLFQRSLFQSIRAFPLRRHLYVKLFSAKVHYPFGLKEVLSIVVATNSLSEYEHFTHRHILHGIQRIFPLIECTKDSFYVHRDEQKPLLTFYMEIEKKEGTSFTLEERSLLTRQLPYELKNSIEHLSPSLFIPRNEEELMRNIITLSHELKYVRDLPQAIISFQEQKGNLLRFNVILLRLLSKRSSSLQTLSHHLPSSMRFLFERSSHVGHIRKKYIKEANVFTLEVKNSLFFRENHSVDLVRARAYITEAIEKMVGKFRDYNGGLLLKQNQRLEAIKKRLPEYRKQYKYLFENLFYSLSPPMMQASLPLEEGASMFSLLLDALHTPLTTQEGALLIHQQRQGSLAVVVKTSEPQLKEQIGRGILRLQFASLKFTKGGLDVEDHSYLSYLLLDNAPEKQKEVLQTIEREIEKWKKQQRRLQIVRFHLPRATQTLDPRLATNRTSASVIKMLYEGLMTMDDKGRLQPAIAETVSISEDQLTYTFTLRDTCWSNEAPLIAYDFVYAWKSIIDPAFSSTYSFLFFPIKNAQKAKRGEVSLDEVGIYALEERVLQVVLEYPTPYFLQLTATSIFSPLWHEIDKKYPGWAHYSEKQYVCNGPFRLDTWKMNNDLTIVKNPLYRRSDFVKLDKIFITIIDNEQTALDMFKREELDWLGDPLSTIPLQEVKKLQNKEDFVLDNSKASFVIQLNTHCPPFQSKKVRQAFAMAIHRQKLIDALPSCGNRVARRFYLDNHDLPPLISDGDDEKALALFKEGLEELGLSKKDISPIRLSHSEVEEYESICIAVARMWEELFTIEVICERILWNACFDRMIKGEYVATGLIWYKRYDDPIYFFDMVAQNSNEVSFTTWKNARYLQLIDLAKRAVKEEEKQKYLLEAEKILVDEMPFIPVLEQKFHYLKNKRLKNVHLSNATLIDFSEAYLSQNEEEEQ